MSRSIEETGTRVVAHYKGGRLLKGYTQDFAPGKETFTLVSEEKKDRGQTYQVRIADLKAVFFVRALEGNIFYREKKRFKEVNMSHLRGIGIRLRFKDGEVIRGSSLDYAIGKDGKIVQHVKDSDRAWHAGRSIWKGRNSCNDYTIGIELVNLNNGQDPYPEAQHRANVALCAYLRRRYNFKAGDIVGHLNVAIPPGRKSDPRGYDLNRLRREVSAALGG